MNTLKPGTYRITASQPGQCDIVKIDDEYVRLAEHQRIVDALAAENAVLKNGIGFFSYGTDSGFEEHDSAEKAVAAADGDIDYYRGDACDGWSEEVDQTVWGVIMQRATMTGLRPVNEDDNVASHITEFCDYTLLPRVETSATDALIADMRNKARAEGAYFVANRMLAAWDAGFIDDTAKNAADIARMILTSTEFMAGAPAGDFDRSFADEILRGIANQLRNNTEARSNGE